MGLDVVLRRLSGRVRSLLNGGGVLLSGAPEPPRRADRGSFARTRRSGAPRVLTKIATAVVLVAGLSALPSSAIETTWPEHPDYPRLPDYYSVVSGQYIGPQARAQSYMEKASQWTTTPLIQSSGATLGGSTQNDPTCTRSRVHPGAYSTTLYSAYIVFMNTDAPLNGENRFGQTQTFEVRTVAFGSIPVQVRIALEQPVGELGATIPAYIEQYTATFCAHTNPFPDRPANPEAGDPSYRSGSTLQNAVTRVRVDALIIDGVDIGLTGTCRSDWGDLDVSAEPHHTWDPVHQPGDLPNGDNVANQTTKFFNAAYGGLLTGTLDVGAFSGCNTTFGDDVSELLTAAVSGVGNPVMMRTTGIQGTGGGITGCPYASNCPEYISELAPPVGPPAG